MGSQDQHRRPDLYRAIQADQDAKQTAADQAAAPEREARIRRLDDDAALYGTAGWEALPTGRRAQVAAHVARQNRQGGADDAT